MRTAVISLLFISAALTLPGVGYAQQVGNYMCDPGLDNCRARLIALIDAEKQAIDAAFWFMEDPRFSQALVRAKNRGVNVRVVTDSRGWAGGSDYPGYPASKVPVDQLYAAGVPIRQKTGGGGILHFKMMLLYGQNMLEFSGANYTDVAFVRNGYPTSAPYSDFVDEAIVFTNDDGLLKSFMTKFDDIWTDVSTGSQGFANYCPTPIPPVQAGCTTRTLTRRNPAFAIDPEMNFVPWNNFSSRAVGRYNAETTANGGGIDAIIYRITDASHTEALIRAAKRGVPVRVITEQQEYRNPNRFWNSYNFDRLYAEGQKCALTPSLCAGTGSISVRFRNHPGLLHEKLTVLRGQQMVIVGSSNWTSGSAGSQHEHNLFATRAKRPWAYDWSVTHFNQKWSVIAAPMAPLPPDRPVLKVPADTAQNQPPTVTLKWYAGLWGMKYDVRLGTSPTNMSVIVAGRELGPSQSTGDLKSIAVTNLVAGTTYYWQVVSSTMADVTRTSAVWSFRTSGGTTSPPATTCGPLPAGWAGQDIGGVAAIGTSCFDATAQAFSLRGSGADIWGAADEFQFAYQQLTGDGTMVVRVAQLGAADRWSKTGVMMRATLSASSAHASMFVSGTMGTAFQRRVTTGGVTTHTSGPMVAAPTWIRLKRAGNLFTASASADGASWTVIGSETIDMGPTIYVGIPLTSHLDGSSATATVSNVSVTTP